MKTHLVTAPRIVVLALSVLSGLMVLAPRNASAQGFTLACEPSNRPAPAGWNGGPWQRPLRLRVNVDGREIELLDADNSVVVNSLQMLNSASLAGYDFDILINENVINFGLVRMWGFSGYIDRRTWTVHFTWVNPHASNQETHVRQFHGSCRPS